MAPLADDTGRLDIRYRVAMAVEVRQGSRWTSQLSEDVSSGGLFIRDPAPPKALQLVRLRTELPFSLGAFEASAVVTRCLGPDVAPPSVAGMGLAFFGLGGNERERWESFILEAARRCPALAETPFRARRAESSTERFGEAPVVEVELTRLEDLFTLHSRDGSRSGIFLSIEPRFSPDERVVLHLIHAASQAEFWVPAFVRRVVRARFRGIAVELADDHPELLRAFRDSLSRLIDDADSA